MTPKQLVEALVEMPQRELMQTIATALAQRTAEVAGPEFEARLCLAEASLQHKGSEQLTAWDVLLFASSQNPAVHATEGLEPLEEGTHCGHVLTGYTKQAICPICGERVSLT